MENGDSCESSFPGKADKDRLSLSEGCRKPVGYTGWFIEGADLIISAYTYIASMSTDLFMCPAPPSNRWWERVGG